MLNWYAVYTNPRWEKKVQGLLQQQNIHTYLPTRQVLKQYTDRKKKVEKIVLPSYLFVQITKEQITEVRHISGVVNFVYWLHKPSIIKDANMQAFMQFMQVEGDLQFEKIEAQVGDTITLEKAPFTGKKATIIKKYKNHLELILENMQIKLTITIKK
jgi:transcription antitermination factor NusG